MKKQLLIVAALTLLVLGALALSSRTPHEKVTIGVLVPLTGKSASIGERVKAGVEVGLVEVRDRGGYDFDVVFEDDKGDATAAVSAGQKLITTNGARILIGTVKSDAMLALAPITEKLGVVLLSPTAGAEGISNAGDFVFRVIETPNIHGEAATKYIGTNRKVALFTAKAANAQSYGKFFKSSFTSAGGIITSDTEYNQDDTDFRTDVVKALASSPDAIYLAVATAKDAGLLTRQIREAGFQGVVMASVAADAKEFFDTAGPYAEGAVLTAPYFDSTTPAGISFNARYKALTGNNGDGFSANGYDAVQLIAAALEKCDGDDDTACIRDFLYATKDYPGAGGVLTFDRNGDVTKPVSIKVARNGVFVIEK